MASSGSVWSQLRLSQHTPNPPSLPLPNPEGTPSLSYPQAVKSCIAAYGRQTEHVTTLSSAQQALDHLKDAESKLTALSERLDNSFSAANSLLVELDDVQQLIEKREQSALHLRAYVDQVILPPSLIRHIIDGDIAGREYPTCLAELSKKSAVYEMAETQSSALYVELRPVLKSLIQTAVANCTKFLHDKISLLKRPNTNVNIVKENALLRHRSLVEFIEHHSPSLFRGIRDAYVETMSRAYFVLFKRYTTGLQSIKQQLSPESADTLVGTLSEASASSLFTRVTAVGGVGHFALGDRLDVLTDVEGPAIVLATAMDGGERYYYEQIHRSLGKMLSETCASEHIFCREFFGESQGRMFNAFFRRIVGFLLDAVKAHTEPTRDTIGVLLALKVNEAQRSSMQMRRILDLADYFIQVDILLKPKFKRLLDENVASTKDAAVKVRSLAELGVGDTVPHIVSRRFAEFSSSLLAIARFGTADDSILEGLRRLRSEYNGFLNAMSTLFTRPKLRYVFLVNNIDHVLSTFRRHSVVLSEDYRSLAELEEVHRAAYVEHEVADHFPDLVSFVRQYERTTKVVSAKRAFPSLDRVRAVLRQFRTNWKLGVQHMQDGVMREFPSFELGRELLQELFERLIEYCQRGEAAVAKEYAQLKMELVSENELVYELRQRLNGPV